MLSKDDVEKLKEAAENYTRKLAEKYTTGQFAKCTYLYRNKPKDYFDRLLSHESDGVMKCNLKGANGDLRSPINGEICGSFFLANVHYSDDQPFPKSPYEDTRVLIRADEILGLTPNMYFADFYCMGKSQYHYVIVVLTKNDSNADQFCNTHLPRLDANDNPFLFKDEEGHIKVSNNTFVEVFVTEDLNLKNMRETNVAQMKYEIPVTGRAPSAVKKESCEVCNIFRSRRLAVNQDNYKEY